MAQQVDGEVGRGADLVEVGLEVGYVVVEMVDVDALALGTPMAAMIERIGGKPARDEIVDDVAIAAAVLTVAVDDQERRAGVNVRQPLLVEDR